MPMLSDPHIYQETMNLQSFTNSTYFHLLQTSTMDASQYCLLLVNTPYRMPQLQLYILDGSSQTTCP